VAEDRPDDRHRAVLGALRIPRSSYLQLAEVGQTVGATGVAPLTGPLKAFPILPKPPFTSCDLRGARSSFDARVSTPFVFFALCFGLMASLPGCGGSHTRCHSVTLVDCSGLRRAARASCPVCRARRGQLSAHGTSPLSRARVPRERTYARGATMPRLPTVALLGRSVCSPACRARRHRQGRELARRDRDARVRQAERGRGTTPSFSPSGRELV